jgi:hypothetical protein
LVPDLAMVPMLRMTSSRPMPMPLSLMVSVRPALSTSMRTNSSSPSDRPGWVMRAKRSLSSASDALEISSRRKISLLEYSECTMRSSSCLTSA